MGYQMAEKELIYLATPYTHSDKKVMEKRFKNVNRFASKLMKDGFFVFSPISHTHPIAVEGDLPRCFEYWRGYDYKMLSCCGKMVVFCQDGWKDSIGVNSEIQLASKMGIQIEYRT